MRGSAAGGRRLPGVEAQTVANTYWRSTPGSSWSRAWTGSTSPARTGPGHGPDRRAARGARRRRPSISAKTGEGVLEVLDELVARRPPPRGDPEGPPRALIFDSGFDQYRGVIAYVRVVDDTCARARRSVPCRPATRPNRRHPLLRPAMSPAGALHAGRGGLPDHGVKDVASSGSATRSRPAPIRPTARCPATAGSSRWSSAACSRSTPMTTRICATHSRSCRSTTRH